MRPVRDVAAWETLVQASIRWSRRRGMCTVCACEGRSSRTRVGELHEEEWLREALLTHSSAGSELPACGAAHCRVDAQMAAFHPAVCAAIACDDAHKIR